MFVLRHHRRFDRRSPVRHTLAIAALIWTVCSARVSPVAAEPTVPLPEIAPESLSCTDEPTGFGLPGFQPGTPKAQIERVIGAPAEVLRGYWGNTTASVYHLIPDRVSLGLLFDNTSNQLRQSEASFARDLDPAIVLSTFDSMLGCRLNKRLRQGFNRVWQRQTSTYSFSMATMEGTVFWESDTRVYIGVWQPGFQSAP